MIGLLQRIMPIIGASRKRNVGISKSLQKVVKIAAVINFVICTPLWPNFQHIILICNCDEAISSSSKAWRGT
jgi:hypothetical protein